MAFWIIAAVLAFAIASWFYVTMLQNRAEDGAVSDVSVYRDQLAEVERDLARGVLSEEAAERSRIEVSRRILAADKANHGTVPFTDVPQQAVVSGALVLVVAIGGAFWLYAGLGAPGYGDLPLADRVQAAEEARAARPSQSEAEQVVPHSENPDADPDLVEMVKTLREALSEREGDVEGLTLLARNEARLGNFAAARMAQQRLLMAKGDEAETSDWTELAALMVFAAGGVVTPDTDRVLAAILEREPQNGAARYYVGLMHAQTGRPDLAFTFWRQLLEEGPEDAPWIPVIRGSIVQLGDAAGIAYSLPEPSLRGPSQEDVAAAADLSPEERAEMIAGMVEGLAERLASEGGPPTDWARLISALGVLGQTERAAAIWQEAQSVFEGSPDAIALIRQGAEAAGVLE